MKYLALVVGALFLFGCAHDTDQDVGSSSGNTPAMGQANGANPDTAGIPNNGAYVPPMEGQGLGTASPSSGESSGVMEPGEPGTTNSGAAIPPNVAPYTNDTYPSLGASSHDDNTAPVDARKHNKKKKPR